MLSIKPLTNSGITTAYFEKDDYYAKDGVDEQSAWLGKGAEELGLEGAVSKEAFKDVLEGRLPIGDVLGKNRNFTLPDNINLTALIEKSGAKVEKLDDILKLKLDDGRSIYKAIEDSGMNQKSLKGLQKLGTSLRFSDITSIDGNTVKVFHHRPGWDFTFSAPKSVSILAEVGGDKRIFEAHHAAVETALGYLEENGAVTRVNSNGVVRTEPTGNLVVGSFQHDTSRAQDPQLHTHSIILNATKRNDGQWRSIESSNLFNMKMTAGVVYRAELAKTLKDLGYEIEKTHDDGRFEIKGVPENVLEEFSKRRQEIEAELKTSYAKDAKSSERVALNTRAHKNEGDINILKESWDKAAKDLGFDPKLFVEFHLDRGQKRLVPTDYLEQAEIPGNTSGSDKIYVRQDNVPDIAKEAVLFASAHLSEQEAVFSTQALVETSLQHAVGEITYSDVMPAIQKLSESKDLIHAVMDGERAWTTANALYLEKSNIAIMQEGRNKVTRLGKDADVSNSLSGFEAIKSQQLDKPVSFTKGQKEAAELILSTKDRVVGVQGYAGTGKTFMLEAVRLFAESQGFEVLGFSQGSAAANVLEKESGIESKTVAKHLVELTKEYAKAESNKPGSSKKIDHSKQIWVVDESSMLSSRDTYELQKHAERTGARLILVGDVQQLPSVEAGKPFYQLQRAGMSVAIMDDIQRQKDAGLLGAVKDSIQGRAREALEKISDTVFEIEDKNVRLQEIAKHYLSLSTADRDSTYVLSPANEDRAILNQLIRDGLTKEGYLNGEEASSTIFIKENMSRVQKARASYYKEGQIVRFGRDYRSLGVSKGEYTTVVGISKNSGVVTLKNSAGNTIDWQPHKVGGNRRRGGVQVFRQETSSVLEGDKIRWSDNDQERGIRNTQEAKVISVEGKNVTFELKDGKRITLDITKPENKHWQHAYTTTVHAAQGGTSKYVLVNGEDWRKNLTNEKMFYTSLSRAKQKAFVYVNDKNGFIRAVEERAGDKTSGLESVDRDFYRNKNKGEELGKNIDLSKGRTERLAQNVSNENEIKKDERELGNIHDSKTKESRDSIGREMEFGREADKSHDSKASRDNASSKYKSGGVGSTGKLKEHSEHKNGIKHDGLAIDATDYSEYERGERGDEGRAEPVEKVQKEHTSKELDGMGGEGIGGR